MGNEMGNGDPAFAGKIRWFPTPSGSMSTTGTNPLRPGTPSPQPEIPGPLDGSASLSRIAVDHGKFHMIFMSFKQRSAEVS